MHTAPSPAAVSGLEICFPDPFHCNDFPGWKTHIFSNQMTCTEFGVCTHTSSRWSVWQLATCSYLIVRAKKDDDVATTKLSKTTSKAATSAQQSESIVTLYKNVKQVCGWAGLNTGFSWGMVSWDMDVFPPGNQPLFFVAIVFVSLKNAIETIKNLFFSTLLT